MKYDDFKKAEKLYKGLSDFKAEKKKYSELLNQVETWERPNTMKLKIGNHNSNTDIPIDDTLAKEILKKQLYVIDNLIRRQEKIIESI